MTPEAERKAATAPSEHGQFSLLAQGRFGPFFGVQFLGAFNDNVFRQALVILRAFETASFATLSSDALRNLARALCGKASSRGTPESSRECRGGFFRGYASLWATPWRRLRQHRTACA